KPTKAARIPACSSRSRATTRQTSTCPDIPTASVWSRPRRPVETSQCWWNAIVAPCAFTSRMWMRVLQSCRTQSTRRSNSVLSKGVTRNADWHHWIRAYGCQYLSPPDEGRTSLCGVRHQRQVARGAGERGGYRRGIACRDEENARGQAARRLGHAARRRDYRR